MDTKKPRNGQGESLHSANSGLQMLHPSAAEIDREARTYPGPPRPDHITIIAWGARCVTDDCDTIDAVSIEHERLLTAERELRHLSPYDKPTLAVADQLNDVAINLHTATVDAVAKAEAEFQALWDGPPVCAVDLALLNDREKWLTAWFPGGSFDSTGRYSCEQISVAGLKLTVQVSASGVWMVAHGTYAKRTGTGLSLLRASTTDKRHSVVVALAAAHYGIEAAPGDDGVV